MKIIERILAILIATIILSTCITWVYIVVVLIKKYDVITRIMEGVVVK
jgi:hypothetical protein